MIADQLIANANARKRGEIAVPELEKAIQEVLQSNGQVFFDVYEDVRALSVTAVDIVEFLASSSDASVQQVLKLVGHSSLDSLRAREVVDVFRRLEHKGVLVTSGDLVTLSIPLFGRWLRARTLMVGDQS